MKKYEWYFHTLLQYLRIASNYAKFFFLEILTEVLSCLAFSAQLLMHIKIEQTKLHVIILMLLTYKFNSDGDHLV